MRNTGPVALPFGLGLHPWFVRTPDVTVLAAASGMWEVADDLLPIAHVSPPSDVDFARPRGLPERLVDHSFTGWSGHARIAWTDARVALEIRTNPALGFFQIYAPPEKPYFCFEPISHPANAFNVPPPHARAGLRALAPGEGFSIAARFGVVTDVT